MMQWWKHIIRIIYTFLKLHLPECIQPKQSLAPTPQNILHSTNIFEPTTDSLLLPGNCFTFFHDCRLQHHSIISVISSKTFKSFVTSCQQPDINASCTQYVLYGRRDISNKLIHHNDTLCIIQCMWLLWSKNLSILSSQSSEIGCHVAKSIFRLLQKPTTLHTSTSYYCQALQINYLYCSKILSIKYH